MKKLIFTVLLVLMASSAFAAMTSVEFPQYYNGTVPTAEQGTQLYMTGFGIANGTADHPAGKTWGGLNFFRAEITQGGAKSELFLVNASNIAAQQLFNGTVYYINGTDATEKVVRNFGLNKKTVVANDFAEGSYLSIGQTYKGITGLTTMARGNNTLNSTTYFVPAGGHQLMVGLTNATANMTGDALKTQDLKNVYQPGNGVTMSMVYQNGTFKNIADGATWDYYAYSTSKNDPVTIFGQVTINSAYDASSTTGNAQARYYVLNSSAGTDKSTWVYYNATNLTKGAAGGNLKLSRDDSDYLTLFENATINKDGNMVTGMVYTGNQKLFAVMVKNAVSLSDSYFMNKGFNAVYAGAGKAAKVASNATAAIMQFRVDGNLELTGTYQLWTRDFVAASGARTMETSEVDLDGYTVAVTTTDQFKVQQSNATFKDSNGNVVGYFYGKRSADDLFSVGIYETVSSGVVTYRSLAFLMPTAATTSTLQKTAANWQSNSSMTTGVTGTVRSNSTGYTKGELVAQWTNLPSDFVPLTDAKGYNLTTSGKMASGTEFYYTAAFQMTGIAGKVSDLQLYKLRAHGTSADLLSYADSATPTVDGSWWISRTNGNGYLGTTSVIEPGDEFWVNWVVKDNGSYDSNNTLAGSIIDPVVLGTGGSSSSSSGCVFNPAAGFGLEWLLLMLAPMVAIVRSRFK